MNIDNSLITVIVPIYNVSAFLEKCVSSIVSQTYRNLEIILVDDGSQDDSPKLCDEWAGKDERITVVHKSNGGLSDARNVGIEKASGDYIVFVDGDDYIAPNMCASLLSAINISDADIAVCNFGWEYDNQFKLHKFSQENGVVIDRNNILEAWAASDSVDFVIACNKLYRKKLFFTTAMIRYPISRLHEDEFTSYRLLYEAKSVVFVDEPFYHYIQHNGSITANFGERNLHDFSDAILDYIPWAEENAPHKRKVMEYMTMRIYLEIMRRIAINTKMENCGDIHFNLKDYINKEIHYFLFNSYASFKDKLKYLLYKMGLYGCMTRLNMWMKMRRFENDT